ncbi:centrosomal protein of 164 kDa-like [Arapaima gigas]
MSLPDSPNLPKKDTEALQEEDTLTLANDEDYIPSEEDIQEFARDIGIDPDEEPELMWLAREGLLAPLPAEWKPREDAAGEMYFFNHCTGESTWGDPCIEFYRQKVVQERECVKSNSIPSKKGKKVIYEKKGKKVPNGKDTFNASAVSEQKMKKHMKPNLQNSDTSRHCKDSFASSTKPEVNEGRIILGAMTWSPHPEQLRPGQEVKLEREKDLQESLQSLQENLRKQEKEEVQILQKEKEERVQALKQQLQAEEVQEKEKLKRESQLHLKKLQESVLQEKETHQQKLRVEEEEELQRLQKEKEERIWEELEAKLQELRTTSEAEFKVEKEKLEDRRKADLEALRQENNDLLEVERHRLQREREEQLEALRSEVNRNHLQCISLLLAQVGGLLQEMRQEIQGEHKQMLELLREEHHCELKSIRENHLVEREKLLSGLQEERRRLLAAHNSHQEDLQVQLDLKLQQMHQEQTFKESELKEQGQQLEIKFKELKAETAALHAQVEDLKMRRQQLGDEEKEMQREKEVKMRDSARTERDHLQDEIERVREESNQERQQVQKLKDEKLQLENKVEVLQEHLEQLSHGVSGPTRQPVYKSSLSNTEVHNSTGSQPKLAVELQQLTESVQHILDQLNSVLGALDCLAQRQAPVLPPAQPSYTSLPSPVHHSDRHVENRVMHSAYSGHTPASEPFHYMCTTLPTLAELDSQRVQHLIESNRRWLQSCRRNSNMYVIVR